MRSSSAPRRSADWRELIRAGALRDAVDRRKHRAVDEDVLAGIGPDKALVDLPERPLEFPGEPARRGLDGITGSPCRAQLGIDR